jgi:hypothetical protein
VILTFHQAERQSTRRFHRAPPFKLAGDDRSQLNQPVSRPAPGNLQIKVDSRPVVPNLLVDIRVACGWSEAAKFREARPRLAERPAQRRGPEACRFLGDIRSNVDEDMQPLSLLSQGASEHRH